MPLISPRVVAALAIRDRIIDLRRVMEIKRLEYWGIEKEIKREDNRLWKLEVEMSAEEKAQYIERIGAES